MKIQGPNHQFIPYYEDSSLLVQFILAEFIQTYQLTIQIKILIEHCEDKGNKTAQPNVLSLVMLLNQLVGRAADQRCSSRFSNWTQGSLTKLKRYCELLSHHSPNQKRYPVRLNKAVHQTWLAALDQLEFFEYIQPIVTINEPKVKNSLKKVKDLHARFHKVIQQIPKLLYPYWNNENVVLCLLRHKDPLTQIYGEILFYQTFKCQSNLLKIKELIIRRYQNRGFNALLPQIKQLFPQIETVDACP